ncbi:TetR family transcriptional regulator [Prauserella shujinwangii]|uniref:TetR family transcriptional regulator n=1 Tax=Prauserella shujinwangii TaxID=1453103 RepID=A0A2T0LTW0_9PSEU|nr:TetR/AcrR family transcriptional regulator [Prauserella shujinwangii]PRX47178.1 TetR family transcriptional regulator [Prauserella shujinwangii]
MGRPPRHTADDLLDAAVRLFAAGGARNVTMSAVAQEAGAASGSVYHRFADRPALLAALWVRTVRRFQAGWFEVLAREPPLEAAVASLAHTVRWCREHPGEAQVLYAGRRAFGDDEWSVTDRAAAERTDRDLEGALRNALRRLRPATGLGRDELLLVLVDLPYAAVRRYLTRNAVPPAHLAGLVARTGRTLLTAETEGDTDGRQR